MDIKLCCGIIFIILFNISTGSAQRFDEVISSNQLIDCDDVTLNASRLVSKFYDSNDINKIYDFLDYWESKCGQLEEIQRLRTILDIDSRRFILSNNKTKNQTAIEDMLKYRTNLKSIQDSLTNTLITDKKIYISLNNYNILTQDIARKSNYGSIDERLILDFYASDNPDFSDIKNVPDTSVLGQMYKTTYEETYGMWHWHWAFAGGVYLPKGNIALFGARPTLGIIVGGKKLKHNLDFIMDIRIGPSENEYSFVYQGELLTDDTWSGAYLGAEYTYDFISTKRFDLGISGGLGYESITALSVDEDSEDDDKILGSFNRNAGLVVKYKYGRQGRYFGLHFRYHWADYDNRGGTQLDGNYLNIKLIWGRLFGFNRNNRLDNLE